MPRMCPGSSGLGGSRYSTCRTIRVSDTSFIYCNADPDLNPYSWLNAGLDPGNGTSLTISATTGFICAFTPFFILNAKGKKTPLTE
jgi:hypothetical protein